MGAIKLATVNNTSSPYFIISDHLGSSSILTDSTGTIAQMTDYNPYGKINYENIVQNFDNNYKYTGKELDLESSLQYFGARYLDNSTTKFYSVDPILIKYNFKYYLLTNPQKLNSYSYGYNNPVYFVDLDGNEGYSWRDIPGVKQLLKYIESHPAQSTNVAVGFTPVAGEFQDAYEAYTGTEAWTGNDLSTTQRLITSGSFVLPFVGGKLVRKGAQQLIKNGNDVIDAMKGVNKNIDWGKQGKHLIDHNNYVAGKSIFSHSDPQSLIDEFSGTGKRIYNQGRLEKEVVDFSEDIGQYVNPGTGKMYDTTIGTIHYSQSGTHIVPERPDYFNN